MIIIVSVMVSCSMLPLCCCVDKEAWFSRFIGMVDCSMLPLCLMLVHTFNVRMRSNRFAITVESFFYGPLVCTKNLYWLKRGSLLIYYYVSLNQGAMQ